MVVAICLKLNSMLYSSQVLTTLKRDRTFTMMVYTEAKIKLTMARHSLRMHFPIMHDLCAELRFALKS
jgi:hypothetical protein